MATGENSGAWGTITNNNLSAIEEAIARTTDVAFSATATVAITLADSNALQQGRNFRLNLTGSATAGQILLLPTVEKSYLIENNLAVDVSVRNGTAAGTNAGHTTVAAGKAAIVYTDGSAVTSAVDSASSMDILNTLNVGGAASVGGAFTVTGNQDNAGTLSVVGAASVGATLGVTGNASVTGTFTFATANSTGNLGVVGNASVGGTFHIQGNASAQGTLNVKGAVSVSSTLGVEGDIDNESGNLTINPATQIVEVKGDGSSVEGQIQLNCHDNSHGQRLRAQPHSEGVTNTMLLPQGASSTLVSQVGTATLTNKTYLDVDGNLRSVPNSRVFGAGVTDAATASALDNGNFILFAGTAASVQNLTLPATVTAGAVFTLVNTPFGGKTAASTTTISAAGTAFIAGGESATAVISLGFNGVATVLYVTAGGCFITGNVS